MEYNSGAAVGNMLESKLQSAHFLKIRLLTTGGGADYCLFFPSKYSGLCYNERFLSIKSGCYNEHGGILSADLARACA